MALVRAGQAVQIRGGDGSIIWEGTGTFGQIIEFAENSATATPATNTINRGEAVYLDAVNSTIGPAYMDGASATSAQVEHIYVKRIDAASNVGLVGVALNTIPIRDVADLVKTKYAGPLASTGSLMLVKCLAAPASNALGNYVLPSATAGSVDANTLAAATTAGRRLGILVKQNGVGAGLTGSTTYLGVFVSQS